jgi:DNA-binding transcriptional LysR family regulator
VCASPAYLAKHGRPKTIAALEDHNCLGYTLSRDVGVDRWLFGRDGKQSASVKANLEANNGDVLVAAAVATTNQVPSDKVSL